MYLDFTQLSSEQLVVVAQTHELDLSVGAVEAGEGGLYPVGTAAMEELLRRFTPLMTGVARRYADVSFEDAAQEAALALVVAIRQYDASIGIPFAAYAVTKVRGDVRSAMRREWTHQARMKYRDASDDEVDDFVQMSGDESGFGLTELEILLDAAGLSPRERLGVESLCLGYSCPEVARKLHVSAETVKTWRKRAMRKLRHVLSES